METVTIKDVTKNERDWYEITLEGDDRVLATKDSKLAEVATASIGGAVEVGVNTRTKGTYTNHYLESVGGVAGDKPKFASKPTAPRTAPSGGRDKETQERIARQWAFGRAVELLMASDTEFSFPLSPAEFEALQKQADALLSATR